tara:strand:+ start:7271 stop:8059 length:789 start_codon:yes stop_codon:yes gene_type:complete
MMGANHAITGAAGWVALTASAPVLTSGLLPLGPVGVFTGAIVCAGAALLPDADHHNGTIAHSVPVVGTVVAGAIGQMAGGHRQGLHSLLATGGVLALSLLLGVVQVETELFGQMPVGAGVATMALVAFAAKALKLTHGSWVLPWILGFFTAAGIIFFAPTEINWLPVAITVGFIIHLLGDMLTIGGVPLLWPLKPKPLLWWQALPILNSIWQKNGYFALPILGKTGSVREWILGTAVTLYVTYVLIYEGLWAFGINLTSLLT